MKFYLNILTFSSQSVQVRYPSIKLSDLENLVYILELLYTRVDFKIYFGYRYKIFVEILNVYFKEFLLKVVLYGKSIDILFLA